MANHFCTSTSLQMDSQNSKQCLSIFTGRNEVLAKVIFSQACVILSTGGSGPGGVSGPGGLQILGGVWSRGVLQIFRGGGVWSRGVLQIFGGGRGLVPGGFSKFSGGGLHRNMVNVRPVRILLECILVTSVIKKKRIGQYAMAGPLRDFDYHNRICYAKNYCGGIN